MLSPPSKWPGNLCEKVAVICQTARTNNETWLGVSSHFSRTFFYLPDYWRNHTSIRPLAQGGGATLWTILIIDSVAYQSIIDY
ncbi:hypothetical protein JTE90_025184 [Oedothorax gibbosus]|uniref:Uncharacterized protein n=1 Tax=Oedothorax gibbosus TaxID=931172 RepID=A0AAV6UCG4_9ARAC|nr:hypothetical protein JTE90_025184 [Oedothorax gibbosus]